MKAEKPKKQEWIVDSTFKRSSVLAVIAAIKCVVPMLVIIKPYNKQEGIRDAQRRLYWQIMGDLAATDQNEIAGHDKDYWHLKMKLRFLLPIYERELPQYAEMIALFKQCEIEAGRNLYVGLARLCTITEKTDTPQQMVLIMREYIQKCMDYARHKGVLLTIDKNLFETAMGEALRYSESRRKI